MSGDLILPSLEIRGFRAFRELAIERLGRVNLIVGKNNVGKTSVLEALRLYANPSPRTLLDLLSIRSEIDPVYIRNPNAHRPNILPIEALFYEGPVGSNRADELLIGPIGQPDRSVRFQRTNGRPGESGGQEPAAKDNSGGLLGPIPYLARQIGSLTPKYLPVEDLPRLAQHEHVMTRETEDLNAITAPFEYIDSNGIDSERSIELWRQATFSGQFHSIVESLRIIEPLVNQVSVFTDSRGELAPIVWLNTSPLPVILRSMGDGMVHLFNVGLALASIASRPKNGLFLADEIENGLHYTIHEDLWRFVFKMATDLKVQVFATTHSWDCIEAFQRAACADTSSEGYLIRLGRKRDDVVATVYDETDLAIVTRDHIEVR